MTAHSITIKIIVEKNHKPTLAQLQKKIEKFLKNEEKNKNFEFVSIMSE